MKLEELKAGDYVKIDRNTSRDEYLTQRVKKITKTQIVTEYPSYGDPAMSEDRYKLSDGREIGSFYTWRRPWVTEKPVSAQEIQDFLDREKNSRHLCVQRRRCNTLKTELTQALTSSGKITADKIKLDYSSSDGLLNVNWSLKLENLSEDDLNSLVEILVESKETRMNSGV